MMGNEKNELLDFARALSEAGGVQTLRYFRQALEVENKEDHSPVTIADKETELFMRRRIEVVYPDHGILGEEFGEKKGQSPYTWIIDPIDGTKSFIHGLPLYTVLVAVLRDGEPYIGVIHQPVLRETVWAIIGGGCFYNGEKTTIRLSPGLDQAWLQVTDPADLLRRWPGSEGLLKTARYVRTWGDGYGYLLVASGRADLMIDAKMHLWDVACLAPIITEAGGVFCDLEGRLGLGDSSIAGRSDLVEAALGYLRP